jgi:cbb3-type cytochrome oxidase subunit 3
MYQTLASLAQATGTFFFMTGFFLICAYALRPKNRDTFDRAARATLTEDDTP